MDKLIELVRAWGAERGLDKADPCKQMLKLTEEVGELAQGLAKNKPDQIRDSIGDVYITLEILAQQLDLTVEECVAEAYEVIKNRNGKMVNGVYVKEEDL